jgi:hypothetical protein
MPLKWRLQRHEVRLRGLPLRRRRRSVDHRILSLVLELAPRAVPSCESAKADFVLL